MKRYLLFFSYLGTQFRAVQKELLNKDLCTEDPTSIQGILEIAAKRFCPKNEPILQVSSRTDQGVHAMRTSGHIDLEKMNGADYDPEFLLFGFNRYFEKAAVAIRVQSCQIVPDTFHARFSAKSRTYLYRLAVRKPDAPSLSRMSPYVGEIPFAEWRRCHFIQDPNFDVEKVQAAAALLLGVHDFRSFMGQHGNKQATTVRELMRLDVQPGRPLLEDPWATHYAFWDIVAQGRSFLYRQVRRTVAVLVAIAHGRMTEEDLRVMLEKPGPDTWNSRAVTAPPHGLYLMDVEYDPQDLVVPVEKQSSPSEQLSNMNHTRG